MRPLRASGMFWKMELCCVHRTFLRAEGIHCPVPMTAHRGSHSRSWAANSNLRRYYWEANACSCLPCSCSHSVRKSFRTEMHNPQPLKIEAGHASNQSSACPQPVRASESGTLGPTRTPQPNHRNPPGPLLLSSHLLRRSVQPAMALSASPV